MSLNPNQRSLTNVKGALDVLGAENVISCAVASTETADLVAGQAVKVADVAGGAPKVLATVADTDATFGFIVNSRKDVSFSAYDRLEIAIKGTIMVMVAGGAIARGGKVEVDVSEGTVIASAGINSVVGWAYDKASTNGDLIRVYIETPSVKQPTSLIELTDTPSAYTDSGEDTLMVNAGATAVEFVTVT